MFRPFSFFIILFYQTISSRLPCTGVHATLQKYITIKMAWSTHSICVHGSKRFGCNVGHQEVLKISGTTNNQLQRAITLHLLSNSLLTHSSQASTLPNRQRPSRTASFTSLQLSNNHLIFTALKYVEIGSPQRGYNACILIPINIYCIKLNDA